jgi:hypothetical protein
VTLTEDHRLIQAVLLDAPPPAPHTPSAVRDAPLNLFTNYGIAIAEQVLGCRMPREGLDALPCGPLSGRMLGHIEVDHFPSVMCQHDQHETHLDPTVGTARKSRATSSFRWVFKKARQTGEGGPRGRTRYFSIVDFATGIPSFRNSPRMRGAPPAD